MPPVMTLEAIPRRFTFSISASWRPAAQMRPEAHARHDNRPPARVRPSARRARLALPGQLHGGDGDEEPGNRLPTRWLKAERRSGEGGGTGLPCREGGGLLPG
jgi:hypothetical protein